jgi:hypothetical protein
METLLMLKNLPLARPLLLALGLTLATAGMAQAQETLDTIPRDYGGRDTSWQIDCFQNGQKIISERNLIIDELPAVANQPGYRYGFFTKDRKRVNIETAATSVCIVKQM